MYGSCDDTTTLATQFPDDSTQLQRLRVSTTTRTTTTSTTTNGDVDWETGTRLSTPLLGSNSLLSTLQQQLVPTPLCPGIRLCTVGLCRLRDLVVTRAISKTQALHSLSDPALIF